MLFASRLYCIYCLKDEVEVFSINIRHWRRDRKCVYRLHFETDMPFTSQTHFVYSFPCFIIIDDVQSMFPDYFVYTYASFYFITHKQKEKWVLQDYLWSARLLDSSISYSSIDISPVHVVFMYTKRMFLSFCIQ